MFGVNVKKMNRPLIWTIHFFAVDSVNLIFIGCCKEYYYDLYNVIARHTIILNFLAQRYQSTFPQLHYT